MYTLKASLTSPHTLSARLDGIFHSKSYGCKMQITEQLPQADENNYGTFILLSKENCDEIYACVKADGAYIWQQINALNRLEERIKAIEKILNIPETIGFQIADANGDYLKTADGFYLTVENV